MAGKSTTKRTATNLIRDIEFRSGRRVRSIFDEEEAAGKFSEQLQSSLYSALPRELRDLIWAYTLAPFEDPSQPFEDHEYYYRPGHTARLKTDAALLLTCRRIWLEANEMAMLQAEHSFYYYRAAPDARQPEWLAALTRHNRENLGHLRLYVQMFAIEGLTSYEGRLRRFFLHTPAVVGDFQPRILHVTLRHTDWWYWESEAPLRLQTSWVQAMLDTPDLRSTQTLKLELETLHYKVEQLQPILDELRKLRSRQLVTHLIDGKPAKTEFVLSEQETECKWDGPTTIDGNSYDPYRTMSHLSYYAITLTWKLRFPEYPKAYIPEFRRKPRLVDSSSFDPSCGFALDVIDWQNEDTYISGYRSRYDLPYADESAHKHAIRTICRRRRQQARLAERQGQAPPPPIDPQYFLMSIVDKAVRYVSHRQAKDVEESRWRDFGRLMSSFLPARWEQEGALLKFVDDEAERLRHIPAGMMEVGGLF